VTESEAFVVLGLPAVASWAEIHRAFRVAARTYHPDLASGDAVQFRRVSEAYRVLRETESARFARLHTCDVCKGDKTVELRKGWRVIGVLSCPRCFGTGQI
jgi:DnaJ-class molecular chaperone